MSRSVPLGKQDTFQSVTEALRVKYGPIHPNLSQMMTPTWSEVKGRQIHCKATPTFGGTGALSRLKVLEKPPEQFDDKKRKLRNKEPKAIPELVASFRGGKDKSPCLPVLSTFFHRRSLLFGLVDHGPYLKYFKKNLKVIEQRVNSKPLPKPGFKF